MIKRHHIGAVLIVVLLAVLVAFGALRYQRSSPLQKPGHSSDLNELRAQFNRDKGNEDYGRVRKNDLRVRRVAYSARGHGVRDNVHIGKEIKQDS